MYLLNLGAWNTIFAVPCAVVDQYLKIASPNQLKVLLWVLRHADHGFEPKEPAQALGLSEDAVEEALLFWQQDANLLTINGVEIKPTADGTQAIPADSPSPAVPAVAAPVPEPPAKARPASILTRPQKPDNAFVAKRMAESEEIAYLMQTPNASWDGC